MRSPDKFVPPSRVLAVGPVSKNTVDSAIEVAYETQQQIMLIASRGQVDRRDLGPGYVEGWSTETFVEYVRVRDPEHRILICRDHGGPWQNSAEIQVGLNEAEALASALASLKADVDAGFCVLCIDTSVSPSGEVSLSDALERLITLYEQVAAYALEAARPVAFEIGLEGQRPEVHQSEEFEFYLALVLEELDSRCLPRPHYVVAQTGTKVTETRNTGMITQPEQREEVRCKLRALNRICETYGVALKAHNCDYLDDDNWKLLAATNIAGANVAPQYGVIETRALLQILDLHGLWESRDRFLQLAHESNQWCKWMASPTIASDREKAIIAGHYVFSMPEVVEIRESLARHLHGGISSLDTELKAVIKTAMYRHLRHFCGLVNSNAILSSADGANL
jgi:tagatose-1,6-bisphosphate aldolase non-catalytic subunit AgaZ/GatZ